jgi:hypothetical protein
MVVGESLLPPPARGGGESRTFLRAVVVGDPVVSRVAC